MTDRNHRSEGGKARSSPRRSRDGDGEREGADSHRGDALALVGRIGAHIREVRQGRSLTLEQVAEATGLTKGFLSQLERGDTSVSLATLIRISSVLDIDLPWMFSRSIQNVDPLVRKREREPTFLGGEGVLSSLLTHPTERRMEVFESRLEPGGTPSDEQFSLDSGLGFILVQRGSLEMRFEERTILLGPGDALTYSPREPHTYRNPSDTRSTVVLVMRVLKGYLP